MLLVLLLEAAEPLEKRTQASSLDRTEYKRFFSSFRTFLSAVLVPNVTNISDVESCYRVVNYDRIRVGSVALRAKTEINRG